MCDCYMVWRRRALVPFDDFVLLSDCRGFVIAGDWMMVVCVWPVVLGLWLVDVAMAGGEPGLKVGCLVAGMTAGADSIDDTDVLRHGAMPLLLMTIRRRW